MHAHQTTSRPQGDRDLLCEGHLAQTDIRQNEGPVPLLDTLEQGFSRLDVSLPDVYQFTALAMHDFGGSFARSKILISLKAGGGFL